MRFAAPFAQLKYIILSLPQNNTEVIYLSSNPENKKKAVPLGFTMALAQNLPAMKVFANLPESQQQRCIDRAHFADSKEEMQRLVSDIANSEIL
ncbi:MAG: hypothetical protein LUF33_07040 [Clostridiales bacterium]|nr:hypothetical protein [Clostridiales bacterium]